MADLLPFEVKAVFMKEGAGPMIDLADVRATCYARTIYCFFAYDMKDAKQILAQLNDAGRFNHWHALEVSVRKWVKPKLDWDPNTGTTNFHE